jgi:sec-independent protein translocase protein TatA
MFGLGFQEILLLGLLALLLFGAKRLPDAGKALGQSIREFKKAFQGDEKNDEEKPEHAPDPQ